MILKGNQRGGGQQLAAHLQNSFDNERVEIADVRGCIAQDLSGAFAEWAAEARGTKCTKFLYSLSLNPYQPNGRLTREQYVEINVLFACKTPVGLVRIEREAVKKLRAFRAARFGGPLCESAGEILRDASAHVGDF